LTSLGPLRARWYEGALLIPGNACLFDADGRRIDSSTLQQEGRLVRRPAPDRIDPPRDVDVLPDPVVYGGYLPKHFGHFLLESLVRVWAYATLALGALPFVHTRTTFHVHERELLEAALLPHGAPHIGVSRPTRLASVLVPDQGIELGRDYHPEMIHVYDGIRTSLIGAMGPPERTPVYLSRTRLPSGLRATLGERSLESRLAAQGIRIVHPQELPLGEQLRTVAHAQDVIGLEGTALHLTIFRPLAGARTICLAGRLPESNQQRVDRLRGAEHVHVRAEYPVHPRFPGLFNGRELRLGPYRSFLIPPTAERSVTSALRD
jgi:capsular polysaccharide biosynthesis protein